jgi:hypothetical protein
MDGIDGLDYPSAYSVGQWFVPLINSINHRRFGTDQFHYLITDKQDFLLIVDYNARTTAHARAIVTNTRFPSTFLPSDFAAVVQLTVEVPLHRVGEGPEEGMGVGVMVGCAIKKRK